MVTSIKLILRPGRIAIISSETGTETEWESKNCLLLLPAAAHLPLVHRITQTILILINELLRNQLARILCVVRFNFGKAF
jgi:hypothetical protein